MEIGCKYRNTNITAFLSTDCVKVLNGKKSYFNYSRLHRAKNPFCHSDKTILDKGLLVD